MNGSGCVFGMVGLKIRAMRSVLFIHGYFADARVFDRWLPRFAARGFAPHALTLRGRDVATAPRVGQVSMADYVDDASRVARSLGLPAIVGHSMGGLIAQKLAERGEAAALALLAPAPPRGITVLSPSLLAKQIKHIPALLLSRPLRPGASDLRDLVLNRVPRSHQDVIVAMMSPDSGRAGREMSIGVPVDARRVTCPVLVLTGDDDRFIPPSVAERVAAKYHADLRRLAGHGHMLPMEPGWEVVADTILDWLETI
jgi:pimeloyl-ACP methyl ester carboxylesterase